MRILLNAVNCTAQGPRIVMENLLPRLSAVAPEVAFVALFPRGFGYEEWPDLPNLERVWVERGGVRDWQRLLDIFLRIPTFCRTFRADLCFTLGEIGPVGLPIPHVVLLHRADILNPGLPVDPSPSWRDNAAARYMRWHLSRMVKNGSWFIVQTPVMKAAFLRHWTVPEDRLRVILQSVPESVRNMGKGDATPDSRITAVQRRWKFLFLSGYYHHKNHAILPSLFLEIQRRGFDKEIHFFLTLPENGLNSCRKLLSDLSVFPDQVTNLGVLSREEVARVYRAADALFLPTLVESLGLPYLEAMAMGTPILTSDRDFSRWLCGDLPFYFEPTDPVSIADAIERFMKGADREWYVENADRRLRELPTDWDTVARSYMDFLVSVAT